MKTSKTSKTSTTFQVTLLSNKGYKPVSTLVLLHNDIIKKLTSQEELKATIQRKGINNICIQRLWHKEDLQRYGYTTIKLRVYNKEKIEQENKEKYERIKEEKYLSGEWKRPKER